MAKLQRAQLELSNRGGVVPLRAPAGAAPAAEEIGVAPVLVGTPVKAGPATPRLRRHDALAAEELALGR